MSYLKFAPMLSHHTVMDLVLENLREYVTIAME